MSAKTTIAPSLLAASVKNIQVFADGPSTDNGSDDCSPTSQDNAEKCMCLTSVEGDCSCQGCTDVERKQICFELLGPCTCQGSEEAICECTGYCGNSDERREACETEPGCQWSGMQCAVQVGSPEVVQSEGQAKVSSLLRRWRPVVLLICIGSLAFGFVQNFLHPPE
jgi:hypothetical protein